MKKILINSIIAILLFFAVDFFVFCLYKYKYKLSNNQTYIQNLTKQIAVESADKKSMDIVKQVFRKPINEDKNGKAIIFTGCSNIYGWGLKEDETVTAQLSKYIKNPIYNFGYAGWGLNNTLYFIESGKLFNLIKQEPAIIIYAWADFHVQRGITTFSPIEMNEFFYKLSNGKPERKTQPIIISRFAVLALIKEKVVNYLLNKSSRYKKEQIKLNIQEFIKCKEIIEQKYPNVKFIILLMYSEPFYEQEYFNDSLFSNELEKRGFIIIKLKELTNIDFDEKYKQKDGHPNKEYWEKVTPMLAKKLKEYL